MNKRDFCSLVCIASQYPSDEAAEILAGVDLADVPQDVFTTFCIMREVTRFFNTHPVLDGTKARIRQLVRIQADSIRDLKKWATDHGIDGSTP